MTLLDVSCPPRPAYFGPDGAPPGVELRLDAFGSWVDGRPKITPRVAVVHTNAASVESSVQSQVNYSNGDPSRTHAHYNVGDRPAKTLATDLRAIANSTGAEVEAEYGERDSSFWTIAIETADVGGIHAVMQRIDWPRDCGPFLDRPGRPNDAEIVARILAYESIVWDFPLAVPVAWNGRGVVAHTWPWPYPYFTTVRGKTCPGRTKIAQLTDEILPRAAQLVAAWTAPPEEDPVRYVLKPPPERPGHPWFLRWDGTWSYLTGVDRKMAEAKDLHTFEDEAERYDLVHAEVFGRKPG